MEKIIITNNDKVYNKYKDKYKVIFPEEGSYVDVLNDVRDLVHKGCKIVTHPMAGSLKPNQTPYKSIILEVFEKGSSAAATDYESIVLIENSLDAAYKFLKYKSTPKWNEKILDDFKTVDLSLIENVVRNPMFKLI